MYTENNLETFLMCTVLHKVHNDDKTNHGSHDSSLLQATCSQNLEHYVYTSTCERYI